MHVIKKIFLVLLLAFIIIQFIQPVRNQNTPVLPSDIEMLFKIPANVLAVLKNSCYDCHSNNTHYPWYAFIQPAAWWMASHINKGKADLNFSEFGMYSNRKQQNKLHAMANTISDRTMPLPSYTILHKDAELSGEDKVIVLNWIKTTGESLSVKK